MYRKAFLPGWEIILGLLLSVLGVGLTVYSLANPAPETFQNAIPMLFLQSHPEKDLYFKPANGDWHVGMGNDTDRTEKFVIYKYEGGNRIQVTPNYHQTVRAHTIAPPDFVRSFNAWFGWNGEHRLTIKRLSNTTLTSNVFLVTDLKSRLPDVSASFPFHSAKDNWGW